MITNPPKKTAAHYRSLVCYNLCYKLLYSQIHRFLLHPAWLLGHTYQNQVSNHMWPRRVANVGNNTNIIHAISPPYLPPYLPPLAMWLQALSIYCWGHLGKAWSTFL